jgi:hypothetical protein
LVGLLTTSLITPVGSTFFAVSNVMVKYPF